MSTIEAPANVHGTALCIDGRGILIRGPSGAGKSALALSTLRRAEALGLAAALVADDQVLLRQAGTAVEMRAPAAISGLIEIAGIGILPERALSSALLTLLVDLGAPGAIARMPEAAAGTAPILGIAIRRVTLPGREAAFGADVLVSLVKAWREPDAGRGRT